MPVTDQLVWIYAWNDHSDVMIVLALLLVQLSYRSSSMLPLMLTKCCDMHIICLYPSCSMMYKNEHLTRSAFLYSCLFMIWSSRCVTRFMVVKRWRGNLFANEYYGCRCSKLTGNNVEQSCLKQNHATFHCSMEFGQAWCPMDFVERMVAFDNSTVAM